MDSLKRIFPTREEQKQIEAANLKKTQENYGMKEFNLDGTIVWARNIKNAIRKANNLNNK